jgi:murein DD-endopeptidase MepM/ murein hydrolase activator NlpD
MSFPSLLLTLFSLAALSGALGQDPSPPAPSEGLYRIPFKDGTRVRVFDDTATHRPRGPLDLGAEAAAPVEIVAAADGRVAAIQDDYGEQQSGRAASECRNNYVWIAHPNGEWTLYSHMTRGSTTGAAGLKVGDPVRQGQFLGHEGAVGCAMLAHLHFEVARPAGRTPIDAGGFLTDNAEGRRLREPRFCDLAGRVVKDEVRTAEACRKD